MPPDTLAPPDAATVVVIADWARLGAEDRAWLVELCIGSLGWGSRFGEEFAPVLIGPDASDDALPSGVAMYAVPAAVLPAYALPVTVRVAVAIGPMDGAVAHAIAMVCAADVPVVRGAHHAPVSCRDWCVRDAASLVETVFALQAGETPLRAVLATRPVPAVPSRASAPASTPAATVASTARVVFEPPPVSLIIPSWNRVGYLRDTIISCLAQEYPHCRIIVADDGSTDGAVDLVRSFAGQGVRLVANAHGGGPANRNHALATIDTPYVVWIGDDDLLVPSVVTSRVAMLERVPDADVIHGDMLLCDAQLQPQSQNTGEDWYHRPEALLATLFQRNVIADGGSLISMRVFACGGWYDEAYPKGHDYHLWSRIALRTKVKYDPGVGYLWRLHGSNLGLGGGGNPYADAHRRIVLDMWTRYDRRLLFPQIPWDTLPSHQLDAISALLMAERLGREEAWADAHRFAQLAATLGLGQPASDLARQLGVKAGLVTG